MLDPWEFSLFMALAIAGGAALRSDATTFRVLRALLLGLLVTRGTILMLGH